MNNTNNSRSAIQSNLHIVKSHHYKNFSFVFEGKNYTAELVSSTYKEPHYHWVVFNEQEIIDIIGDTLTFRCKEGKFEALYTNKNASLVETIKKVIISSLL